ncbi:pentapeptide repeat-containing protein [Collimonas fungivorans]|nr:pentapeptide repeat-containing protein [Collimonas fungivorans]
MSTLQSSTQSTFTLECHSNMLFETERFESRLTKPASWEDCVFRYCNFADIDSEGGSIDSIFVGCTFENCEWYWGIFNLAILVQVKFKGCTFRGTAFSGSKFVECEFIDCEFTKDNLNGDCSFDDVAWYKCKQNNCKGLEGEFRNKH